MHEYYLGMKFARALVWSRGLRDRIGLGEEISDEELAQQNFVDPKAKVLTIWNCLLYTSPSPRDKRQSRMPSSA